MRKTNLATLRNNLSSMMDYVQKGKELQIEKRNVPIAKIIPIKAPVKNLTKLGIGKGSVLFIGSVIESAMDEDWEMLR